LKTAPTSQTVSANHSVTFTAAASGTPTPKVQWQVLVKGGSTWTNITGATSASYTFTATAAQTGYQYRAVFTNSLGSLTTAAATLTVTAAVPVVPVHASTITTPTTNLDNTAKTAKVTTLSAPAVDVVLTLL
jgi:hypothetical protein